MSDQISDANNPEALGQLLEGRSDDEINQFVEAAGVLVCPKIAGEKKQSASAIP